MPLDLSAYDIDIGDTRDLVEKLNNAHRAIEAGVNATEDTVTDRLDDQDAIIDGLAGAMTAGVTFKGTHSAAGGSYPAGPAAGDYWIISAAGTISGVYFNVGDSIVYYSSSWIRIPATPDMSAINPLTKAIRVAITAATSGSNGIQALTSSNLNMGTNNCAPCFRVLIPNTRPSSFTELWGKFDTTLNLGLRVRLLTTGHLQLSLNGRRYVTTAALPAATNILPLIQVPITRESATSGGSVTVVVDGVQLGDALAIAPNAQKITNGTFDSDITGWSLASGSGGTIAWNSGKIRIERTSGTVRAVQAISLAAGETLYLKATATFVSGATAVPILSIGLTEPAADANAESATLAAGASGDLSLSYTATAAQTVYVRLTVGTANGIYDFDTVTSVDTASVDNTSSLYVLGSSTTRTAGEYFQHGIYNRAPTVADCARHFLVGPDPADVGASNSAIATFNFSAGTDSFSATSATGTGNIDGIGGKDNVYRFVSNGSNSGRASRTFTAAQFKKNNKLIVELYRPSSNVTCTQVDIRLTVGTSSSGTVSLGDFPLTADAWTSITLEIPASAATGEQTAISFFFNDAAGTSSNNTSGDTLYIASGGTLTQTGITGWWNAEDAQSNTGQIFDRSGNKGHCVLPAAGATILPRPPRTFQVRSTHSWAETHELQYLTLVNQPVVPSTAKLVRIFGEVTSTGGSGPQDFILGDGSDGDRYVVLTSGLTTGKKEFTIDTTYAGFNDGTNLKLTIDPDANCTMTVALVLVFENLE